MSKTQKQNNMETKSDTRNELFKRNEISFSLDSEKNPSFDEIKL